MFIFTPNFVTISSGKIRIFYQEVGHILLPGPFEINAFHHFYFLDLFFCFSPGHEIKKMSPKLNTLKCLLNTLKGDNKCPISWILKSQKYFSHICRLNSRSKLQATLEIRKISIISLYFYYLNFTPNCQHPSYCAYTNRMVTKSIKLAWELRYFSVDL